MLMNVGPRCTPPALSMGQHAGPCSACANWIFNQVGCSFALAEIMVDEVRHVPGTRNLEYVYLNG